MVYRFFFPRKKSYCDYLVKDNYASLALDFTVNCFVCQNNRVGPGPKEKCRVGPGPGLVRLRMNWSYQNYTESRVGSDIYYDSTFSVQQVGDIDCSVFFLIFPRPGPILVSGRADPCKSLNQVYIFWSVFTFVVHTIDLYVRPDYGSVYIHIIAFGNIYVDIAKASFGFLYPLCLEVCFSSVSCCLLGQH